MAFCPQCHRELPDDVTECFYCGYDVSEKNETDAEAPQWVVIGTVESKMYADLAKETLTSSDIPAVIIAKEGFFGSIGLPLHPFYGSSSAPFEISVPAALVEEACELLDMTIGEKWQRKEK